MTATEPAPADAEQTTPARSVGDVPWGVSDAIFVLGLWLVSIIVIGAFVLAGLQRAFPAIAPDAISLLVTQAFLLVAPILYVRVRFPGAVRRLFGPARPTAKEVLIALGAGVVALVVFAFGLGNLIQLMANATNSELPPVQESFRQVAADPTAAPLLVLGSVILGPAAEELFYRGMLFTALRRRLPLWPAMGISGVLFGISHLQSTLEGYLLVLMIVIPLGMFLAWIYDRRRTLVVPIVAHAVFNLVQVVFLINNPGAA